ncbi:MAG: hypothetical protein JRI61_09065 [Deltaproteobacteria bacterium]|nr:hypothetical protein [Deltaproteobacteria bacterium]
MKKKDRFQSQIDFFLMWKLTILLTILGISTSCARLPDIYPQDSSPASKVNMKCDQPFLKNRWQIVHSIKAVLPNDQKEVMIGTIILSPEKEIIHCVITSIEGIVLLEMVYNKNVIINRAIPPFDSADIAEGLMNDIRLIFLKPEGSLIESGLMENGSNICRYKRDDGMTVDVIVPPEGGWEINQYDFYFGLNRTVKAEFLTKHESMEMNDKIPERLELTAHGFLGYKLSLDLIESVRLTARNYQREP